MSMTHRLSSSAAAPARCHGNCFACPGQGPLAEAVHARRLELGYSIHKAARLAGLTLFDWAELEAGTWIPEDGPQLRAIGDTLQADATQVSFYALLSRTRLERLAG